MADSSQRTEKATPRRVMKAREHGDFPAAKEFVAAVQLLIFVMVVSSTFSSWLASVEQAFRFGLNHAFEAPVTVGYIFSIIATLSRIILRPLTQLGGVLIVVTLAVQMIATTGGFSFARLTPKGERLNPGTRVRGVLGNSAASLLQAVVTLPMMGYITWRLVHDRLKEIVGLSVAPLASAAAISGGIIIDALRRAGYFLLLLGIVMLLRERMRYSARLRMSKQEIREEAKENDGNPNTKARIRRLQRDLRRRNMMRDVPSATAVIVNPTHYAVAIRYDRGQAAAPMVVAKGKNYLAARIRIKAIETQVPIIENPPLAQALYKTVEVGQEIPAHLYRAVAEVLAYIYRLMGNGASAK